MKLADTPCFIITPVVEVFQPNIAMHILPEQDQRQEDPEVEIFSLVMFEKPSKRGLVNKMDGKWFDLNGNVGVE